MSILRYEQPASPAKAPVPCSADEALLRLLLISAGALLFLTGWVSAAVSRRTADGSSLLAGLGLAPAGSTGAVLVWVLKPLWPRRYEGSAGVWGVLLLSLGLLLALKLVSGFCCVVAGLAQD